MVSKLQFVFILFVSIFACIPNQGGAFTSNDKYMDKIMANLTSAGYEGMAVTVQVYFPFLKNAALKSDHNTTIPPITIFSPPTQAFWNMNDRFGFFLPPEEIVQYLTVPMKLEREDFNQSSSGKQFHTLFEGHRFVVTTSSLTGQPSINGIEIKDWDIFNDGDVIIHGVVDFFDPGFPMSDDKASMGTNNTNTHTGTGNNTNRNTVSSSNNTNTNRGTSNNSSSRGSSRVHYRLVLFFLALTVASVVF